MPLEQLLAIAAAHQLHQNSDLRRAL
jgi:hypothetical protein